MNITSSDKIKKINRKYYINDVYFHNMTKLNYNCEKCGRKCETSLKAFNSFVCRYCVMKENNLKKYGVENISSLDWVKNKKKETTLKNYNVCVPSQSKKIISKMKQTSLRKYGYESNLSNRQLKEEGMLKKYGVKYPIQSKEIKKRITDSYRKKIFSNIYDRTIKYVVPLFGEEDYSGVNSLYKWECQECSSVFFHHLDNGIVPKCPSCFPKLKGTSKLEKEIVEWIKSLNIETIENNRSIISPLELDVYIPSHNLAIEFNGLYHHSELSGDKGPLYHINKTNLCQEKGIQLLHIFEDEWIEKQDIVKSIIKSKLGLHSFIIFSEKCVVEKISNKAASEFYNENHIEGEHESEINLGLFYENEMISCMSFSRSIEYDWEITRFANKLFTKIESFNRLWEQRPLGSIIAYSDKRLFNGSTYRKHMIEIESSQPSYEYIKNGKRWKTWESNKLDRIWNCGSYIFRHI